MGSKRSFWDLKRVDLGDTLKHFELFQTFLLGFETSFSMISFLISHLFQTFLLGFETRS